MAISPDVVYDRLLSAASPAVAAWIRAHDTRVGPTVDRTLVALRAFAQWADKQDRFTLTQEGITGSLASAIRDAQRSNTRAADTLRNLRDPLREQIVSDGLIRRGVKPVWSMTLDEFQKRPQGVLVPGFPSTPVVLSPDAERVKEVTTALQNEADRASSVAGDALTKLGISGWKNYPNDYRSQIEGAKGQKKAAWEAYQQAKAQEDIDQDALRTIQQQMRWLEAVRYAQTEGRDVPPHVVREADKSERNIDILRFNLRPSTYKSALTAGKQIEGRTWGDPEYHAGKESLFHALKAILENHPTLADVQNDADTLRRLGVDGSHIVASDLADRINAYAKVEQEAKKRAASREKRAARKGYEARSPEYASLISERARLKREIAEATRVARSSPEFRHIGGIKIIMETAGLKRQLGEVEKKITAIERGN